MKSFASKLLFYIVGIVLIGYVVVFFLFNIFIDNYIMTGAKATLSAFDMAFENLPFTHLPSERTAEQVDGDWGYLLPTGQFLEAQPLEIQPIEQSVLNLGIILIGEDYRVIGPFRDLLSPSYQQEIDFLVQYYVENIAAQMSEEMFMVSSPTTTYYLRVMYTTMDGNSLSILLYTDISSSMHFKQNVNQILIVLLAVVGVFVLIVSAFMSARFKSEVKRLCSYAQQIGNGNFHEQTGRFADSEFEQLSASMGTMASMLQSYDDGQKRLFQNASHELRTPLMSINGYAEGILNDVFTKDEAVTIIKAESEKMDALISGILYISRIDSGLKLPNQLHRTSITELLHDCQDRLNVIARKSGKRIVFTSQEDEVSIVTDERKLEIVVINILSNAIRHAENEILINHVMNDGSIVIQIQDDGEGIDINDLPHIFDRFYKGENGNSGLGLSICKDVIESLGGTIKAENVPEPSKGSVFTVTVKSAQ